MILGQVPAARAHQQDGRLVGQLVGLAGGRLGEVDLALPQRSFRLAWPSIMFAQVGEEASSKSAMNTFAPEFSALMIILRSTGPVISTRRSSRSAGIGATRPVAFADMPCISQEIGKLAGVQALLALLAQLEQALARAVELALQVGQKGQRRGRQDFILARAVAGCNGDPVLFGCCERHLLLPILHMRNRLRRSASSFAL